MKRMLEMITDSTAWKLLGALLFVGVIGMFSYCCYKGDFS